MGERESYANIRVDYGRDLVLKQALLSEVEASREPVLDYRGQSLVFYGTLFVPREFHVAGQAVALHRLPDEPHARIETRPMGGR